MSRLSAYQFPCLFRVLHLHEDFYRRIGDHLLRAFLVSLHDACIVLRGYNGGDAEAAPLCQHDFKARRNNGGVFIHNAQIRANAYGISRQGFQHVRRVAFDMSAKAHGAGITDG